jgi:chorismate dehydratase
MSEPESEKSKLRLAMRRTPEEMIERVERERRPMDRQREYNLESSLGPFRVGSVPYLNAVPLTRGLEDEVKFVPPARLAEMLRNNELDAALVSIVEVLFTDRYDVLDGIAIASLGEVFSVFLAHKKPLEQVDVVHCDPASLTSVSLLKVLLGERGLKAEFRPLPNLEDLGSHDYVMLIGNPGIDFRRSNPVHEFFDLGAAWYELTNLPFVYAVWALQRNPENQRLRQQLREAKDFGIDTLDYLIDNRTEYDREFRKDYLGWHIHYHLGSDEKRGIKKFVELLRKHLEGPVHEPKYVS